MTGTLLLAFSEFEEELLDDLNKRHEAFKSGKRRGPTTGLQTLDKFFDGCMEPGIYTMHGQPGSGKTSLAAQMAAECQFPSLFVTCEVEPLELVRRQVARIMKMERRSIFSGRHDPFTDMDLFFQTAAKIPGFHILDARREVATPEIIAGSLRIIRGTAEHVFCVIDSLHSWAARVTTNERDGEQEYLGKAMSAVREISSSQKAPIMLIAERNRANMSNGGMSAGAGSRKIEYESDVLMELKFPGDDKDGLVSHGSGASKIELGVLKNRFGPPGGKVSLNFMASTMSFTESILTLGFTGPAGLRHKFGD